MQLNKLFMFGLGGSVFEGVLFKKRERAQKIRVCVIITHTQLVALPQQISLPWWNARYRHERVPMSFLIVLLLTVRR